jgi:choline dehydrogenase-like flavoprotein
MEFDYVIVGGGSAGSVLAARLSEDPGISVCLLEAGGDGKGILVRAPIGMVAMLPGSPKINNWAFETVPQAGLNGRRGYQPRGRALGGSSAINAMLYVRGHPTDYDDWAKAGCEGWSWSDVLPVFRRSEAQCPWRSDGLHGEPVPCRWRNSATPRPISHAFVDAAAEVQIRRNDDFNGPEQEGAGLFQVTQFWQDGKQGERCSAAAAYLHPVMTRPNLTVITGAQATRVLIDGARPQASPIARAGPSIRSGQGPKMILCGGAFNSPQLLMLSGIGPGEHLRSRGIDVFRHCPASARTCRIISISSIPAKTRDTDVLGLGAVGTYKLICATFCDWRRDGSGLVATPGAEAVPSSNPIRN